MKPAWFSVSINTPAGLRIVQVEGVGRYEVQDAAFELAFDGEVLELSMIAAAPCVPVELEIGLVHDFDTHDKVLVNGWQSWTTTQWLGLQDRMRGLAHVPQAVVDRWALDGGGDYRFVDYTNEPGKFHGFTYAAVRSAAPEEFILVASLDETNGFTLIKVQAETKVITLEPECAGDVLQAGQRRMLGRWCVLHGTEDACYDRWCELAGYAPRVREPLVGYSSWYRHYEDISEEVLRADLAGCAAVMASIDTGCARRVFQVDDGWCKKGDWATVNAVRFPQGLAPVAHAAADAGFTPGLWMAPFVCEKDSQIYATHPDWLLKDEEGNLVRTGSHWSGAYALDSRNPEVRDYVSECVARAVHQWGFGLLKLDFLYAACLVPHDGMNRGQLMADAWDVLRAAAGEDALLLACGVPLGSVFGRADFCRVGCDVGPTWDDLPHMRLLHRERVSTKNSLENTLARAPLNGRVFGCDPDVVFLRNDVRLTAAQKQRLLSVDVACGNVLLTSDDMGAWTPAQRAAFAEAAHVMVARGKACQ